ncbi:methyltransferase [Pseudoponticoccus marisrubri]|uniref:SAM-dependent methyltransferase n=1 Tax=Pseudoponticoccus marisrubri TaxID=1685382 RepID=A0A0W7WHE9_9RHOB|nr:methyltransferase [Pseudoponticoccus marisrubri]KUF10013.1 SAM-dependent methyltransferase [Pseudoponticoccus marisrubri]
MRRPGAGWLTRLIADPGFQRRAARWPLLRRLARRDGAQLFDIVQGFVRSQALLALVELDLPERLLAGPAPVAQLALESGLSPERMALLIRAGVALGLLRQRRDGCVTLTRQGAALAGVPGLQAMIRHHGAFYRDMGDPVALLRGGAETELAAFWPYVFGAEGAADPEVAATYSEVMAQSQRLVAGDTLAQVDLRGARRLMDVGGGTGAFLEEAAAQAPGAQLVLFDLPAVVAGARDRFDRAGLSDRVEIVPGSFRDDPLPRGADVITLVRVLYDHADDTVAALLRAAFDALEPGGRLVISEPMSGGTRPDPQTDLYFAFYTLAMRTGRTRSAEEIGALCRAAGFDAIRAPRPRRAYVTACVEAVKPA